MKSEKKKKKFCLKRKKYFFKKLFNKFSILDFIRSIYLPEWLISFILIKDPSFF